MISLKKLFTKILVSLKNKVSKTGDTMTGNLQVQNAYINISHNDNQAYVEAQGASGCKVRLASVKTTPEIGVYDGTNSQWIVDHNCNVNKTTLPKLALSASTTVKPASTFSGANQKYCYLFRIGTVVFMSMSLGYSDNSTTIPTGTTLFTIPAGYCPVSEARLPMQCSRKTTAQSYPASLIVGTDGTVVQNASSTATGIYCVGMWEIA